MEWTSLLLIAVTSFGASLLTFFAGFGLGTILLPVFALFFSVHEAVALTAIVHLLNNLFKFSIVGKYMHYQTIIRFGLPAIPFAFLGSYLLGFLPEIPFFTSSIIRFSWLKIVIGFLLIFFSLFDIIPSLKKLTIDKKYLSIGGVLSGFFGGLSGHQGALRSAFLIKLGLEKQVFIATGIAIACLIDLSRLAVYANSNQLLKVGITNRWMLLVAVLSAFIGAYMGNQYLKKLTLRWLQQLVGVGLIIFGLLLIVGIL
jgi:uncharacterized membrane protein YfcA